MKDKEYGVDYVFIWELGGGAGSADIRMDVFPQFAMPLEWMHNPP